MTKKILFQSAVEKEQFCFNLTYKFGKTCNSGNQSKQSKQINEINFHCYNKQRYK